MKKRLFLLAYGLLVLAIIVLPGACKHEVVNSCATNPINLIVTKTDASPSNNDGVIKVSAGGGIGFRYSLNGGAFQSDSVFSGLPAGMGYKLIVVNHAGCSDSTSIDINTNAPCNGIAVSLSVTKVNPTTSTSLDGSITVSASGGKDFGYSLNNGPYQNSGNFSGLAGGTYTVTAINSEGCTGSTTVIIGAVDPCAGVAIVVNLTKTDPTSGANGSISASASGSSSFTYSINGGSYQSSSNFSGLAAGSYTISAKTANGCTGSSSITLVQTGGACSGVNITVSLTKTDPTSGSNGTINATATGATGLSYSLNGGAYQSSGSFTGLAAGSYTVTAKSSAGCTGSATITLNAANACSGISISISTSAVNTIPCAASNIGSITVTASGSSGYTYSINGGAYQASNVFGSLAAGTYTIGVKDANGCSNTTSATVSNVAAGAQYTAVKSLLLSKCGGCHTNGGSSGGYNFDTDCSIISAYSKIQSAAVTNGNMPPSGPLSSADKQTITNWVSGGHGYTN